MFNSQDSRFTSTTIHYLAKKFNSISSSTVLCEELSLLHRFIEKDMRRQSRSSLLRNVPDSEDDESHYFAYQPFLKNIFFIYGHQRYKLHNGDRRSKSIVFFF